MHIRAIQSLLAFVLLTGSVQAGSDKPPEPVKRLMWHLFPAGSATPELASRVEKSIRTYFEQRKDSALMDAMKMDSLLLVEGNEKFLRCGIGAGCLSGLGESAGVSQVIAGEVNLHEGQTTVRLVLVDVESKTVISESRVSSSGLPDQRMLGELRIAMFQPERYRGSLELEVSAPGAEVTVDGRKMGVTPLVGPLSDLPAGEHLVEIRKPGHETFRKTIRIPLSGTATLQAVLIKTSEPPKPFYLDWPFWTTAGVGVLAMTTGAVLHADAAVLQDNADACREQNLTCADEQQDKADARYLQTYLAYGVGGAGLLAAGIIILLDVTRSGEPDASVELITTPTGLGLGATFRF